jgi:predicted ester cyclase
VHETYRVAALTHLCGAATTQIDIHTERKTAMSIEENKNLARRFLDLVSEHAIKELCELVAPTWTMRGGPPNLPAGHEGIRMLFQTIGPVAQSWAVDDVIAEGDKVVVRATNTVVQDSFFGIDGHGKQQVFTAIFIHRVADGLIQQTWRNADDLGRLFQLGARVVPGAAEE